MKFAFERISDQNLTEYIQIFQRVFGRNLDAMRVDINKKLNTTFAISDLVSIVAKSEDGEIAGALGLYPVLYQTESGEFRCAAQIGDAMVNEAFRGMGLFTQLIEEGLNVAKQTGIDFIFTFPSLLNQGSYKGFVKTGFMDIGGMTTYTKNNNQPKFLSRLIRKLSQSAYLKYVDYVIANSLDSKPFGFSFTIERSMDYLIYKSFNKNRRISLLAGDAWVSICSFSLLVSDFNVKPGYSIGQLVDGISSLAAKTGKDYIQFSTNHPNEIDLLDTLQWNEKNDKIRVMIFNLNSIYANSRYVFNYGDVDIF
jgi:predicted N-acetyltransferase YhbS